MDEVLCKHCSCIHTTEKQKRIQPMYKELLTRCSQVISSARRDPSSTETWCVSHTSAERSRKVGFLSENSVGGFSWLHLSPAVPSIERKSAPSKQILHQYTPASQAAAYTMIKSSSSTVYFLPCDIENTGSMRFTMRFRRRYSRRAHRWSSQQMRECDFVQGFQNPIHNLL